MEQTSADPIVATLTALQRSDRDRYLCALVTPADLRADLATLYAFNAEIAGIAEKVSESMLGLIRLQWWRDALGDVAAGRPHRHHLVQALAAVAARRSIDIGRLQGMLDAREADLDPAAPANLVELETYVAATAGALSETALEICQAAPDASLRQAARDSGTAYGLTGILRATPHLARQRIVRLPAAEMAAASSSVDRLCDLKPDARLPQVTAMIAERATALLAEARKQARVGDSRRAIAALLPGKLASLQLERLRRHGYDLFVPGAVAGSGLDIWRLLAARWSRRF